MEAEAVTHSVQEFSDTQLRSSIFPFHFPHYFGAFLRRKPIH